MRPEFQNNLPRNVVKRGGKNEPNFDESRFTSKAYGLHAAGREGAGTDFMEKGWLVEQARGYNEIVL